MLLSAARRKGINHLRCDDRFYFRRDETWSVAALCDGAGSRPFASEGSKIASRALCLMLPDMLSRCNTSDMQKLTDALRSIPMRLRLAVLLRYFPVLDRVGIGDFSATLLFAAKNEKSGEWIVGHIGDGVIATLDNDDRLCALSHPQNGEFANSTIFFTDVDADLHLRLYRVLDIRGIALMSDGSAHTLYRRKDGAVAPALKRFFEWQRALGAAKGSSVLRTNLDRFVAPATDDDCSIVLM